MVMVNKQLSKFWKWFDSLPRLLRGFIIIVIGGVGYGFIENSYKMYTTLKFTELSQVAFAFQAQIAIDVLIFILLAIILYSSPNKPKRKKRRSK